MPDLGGLLGGELGVPDLGGLLCGELGVPDFGGLLCGELGVENISESREFGDERLPDDVGLTDTLPGEGELGIREYERDADRSLLKSISLGDDWLRGADCLLCGTD